MDSAKPTCDHDPESTPFFGRFWDPKTFRVLCTLLLFALVLGFVRAALSTLTLFLFAILFAYFLAPAVARLQIPLKSRGRAIAAVYVLMAGVLVAAVLTAGPNVSQQARELVRTLPSLLNRLGSGELLKRFAAKYHWSASLASEVNAFLVAHRSNFVNFAKAVGTKLAQSAQHIWWLVLIPILGVFFLKEGRELASGLASLGGTPTERSIIQNLLEEINRMLGGYLRSQLILAGLTFIAYSLVLSVMHLPYALALGLLAAILEFVPVVGPSLAGLTVIAVSVLAGSGHWIWLLAFVGLWRLVQDYVNAPRILKNTLEIDPLLQIFAVLGGAEIAGVLGALLAVPLFATLRIIWRFRDELRSVG